MADGDVGQVATFRTGATWRVDAQGIIRMMLGPWRSEDEGLEEAQFMQQQFQQLKTSLQSGQQTSAIVDLTNITHWDTAHLAMLQIYAGMTKDPVTKRVAIVHATGMQKVLIVPLIKLVVHNRDKLQFFDDGAVAEAWISE